MIAVGKGRVTDPAVRSRVNAMLAGLRRLAHVTQIASPYGPHGASQIGPAGQVAFANVTVDLQATKISSSAAQEFVRKAQAATGQGVEVEVEGQLAELASQTGSSPRSSARARKPPSSARSRPAGGRAAWLGRLSRAFA